MYLPKVMKMINFIFVLLPLFFVMVAIAIFFREHDEGISQGLLYLGGIGLFILGIYIMLNGLPDVSHFLAETTGIIFWGFGGYTMYRASLKDIEEDW